MPRSGADALVLVESLKPDLFLIDISMPGMNGWVLVERLRALILDLAVRGKLVPQDPADEPAADILKRAKLERARLNTARKAKEGKPLSAHSDYPFSIPSCQIPVSSSFI